MFPIASSLLPPLAISLLISVSGHYHEVTTVKAVTTRSSRTALSGPTLVWHESSLYETRMVGRTRVLTPVAPVRLPLLLAELTTPLAVGGDYNDPADVRKVIGFASLAEFADRMLGLASTEP